MKQTIILRYKSSIVFWLAVVLASIVITMLSSCGTRKVVIDEIKKDSLSQISTKIVTKEDVKIETKNDIVIDEFIITPLDTCKDIVVNGITYKNVVLSYKKTKDNTIQVQDIKVSKIEDKQQTTKVEVKEKKKEIDKKANYFLYFIPTLILILIYFIWRNKWLLL
jgi:hypothetical protein